MRRGLVCFSERERKKKKNPPANAGLQLLARSCPPQLGALFPGALASLSTAQPWGMAAWTAGQALWDP